MNGPNFTGILTNYFNVHKICILRNYFLIKKYFLDGKNNDMTKEVKIEKIENINNNK